MHSASATATDDRTGRRDRACVAGGFVVGAGLGALLGSFGSSSAVVLIGIGALSGAIVGRLIASHIPADEWDPTWRRRSYVGTNSPDDDLASP